MRALIPTDAVEGAKMWKADPDSVCSEVLAFAGTSVLVDETGEYASTAFLLVGVIGGAQRLLPFKSNGRFLKARRQHESQRASDRLISCGRWAATRALLIQLRPLRPRTPTRKQSRLLRTSHTKTVASKTANAKNARFGAR
jgi:hypothetical protein